MIWSKVLSKLNILSIFTAASIHFLQSSIIFDQLAMKIPTFTSNDKKNPKKHCKFFTKHMTLNQSYTNGLK